MRILPRHISLVIHPSFWFLALVIAWLNGPTTSLFIQWILVVFVSVFVHELGHATMSVLFGQSARIELGLLGGVTVRQGTASTKLREFLIVLMGPLWGLLLGGLCSVMLITGVAQWAVPFLQIMVITNFFWSLLNLLPVYPLDGGKLMAIILEVLLGSQGLRLSHLLSAVFAIACTAFFIFGSFIIPGVFFLLCAFESGRNWKNSVGYETSESKEFFNEIAEAEKDWASRQPERAIHRLEEVISQQTDGTVFIKAIDLLSNYLLSSEQTKRAYAILAPLKNKILNKTLKQFQLVCYKLGNWDESLETGKKIFLEEPNLSCAILNAFSSAHLYQIESVVNWMTYVKKAGGADIQAILSASDFDELRDHPLFRQFCKEVEH